MADWNAGPARSATTSGAAFLFAGKRATRKSHRKYRRKRRQRPRPMTSYIGSFCFAFCLLLPLLVQPTLAFIYSTNIVASFFVFLFFWAELGVCKGCSWLLAEMGEDESRTGWWEKGCTCTSCINSGKQMSTSVAIDFSFAKVTHSHTPAHSLKHNSNT